jgi:peptide/nickel transport system substrate-binding protein
MKNKLLSVCLFVFLFSIIFLLLGCPPVDKPPKLTIPDKTVDEGQVLQFDLKQYAEDKDKNTLVFTIVSGVGEIVGSDYRYAPTFDNSGEKEVKIRVTNAKGKSAEDTFKITVNDVNRPPALDIPDQTIDEGETLTLNLNDYADDPDGDDLTFALVSGVGEITVATYTYTPDYDVLKKVREYNPAAESVDFEVSISANDGKGGEATTTFTIRVTDVNRPPVLDIPDQTIDEGETLTLNLLDYTTDPDTLDTFTYTLISGVGNIAGSTYTYTATYTDAGTKTVTVRVTDNKGGTGQSVFGITVNRLPVINKLSGPSGTINQSSVTFSWTGNDPDGEIEKYEYRKDEGNWIDHGLNTSYTWSGYAEGPHKFEVRAQDNKGVYSEPAEWSFTFSASESQLSILRSYYSVETLDPHKCVSSFEIEVVNNLYDNLIMYDRESLTEFLPMIATEVPSVHNGLISQTGEIYTFPIRHDVKFHTGNDLTPEDVKYSFERGLLTYAEDKNWVLIYALSGGKFSTLDDWFGDYSGMRLFEALDSSGEPVSTLAREKLIGFYENVIGRIIEIDSWNVTFNIGQPFAPFLSIIAHFNPLGAIIDSRWAKDAGEWNGEAAGWWRWYSESAVSPLVSDEAGSGPYKFVAWNQQGEEISLESFEDYWKGKPSIDRVIIKSEPDNNKRKTELSEGTADIVDLSLPMALELQAEGICRVDIFTTTTTNELILNWGIDATSPYIGSGELDGNGIPPNFFSDINIRKAFLHAYDGITIINECLGGMGEVIPTIVPKGFLGYDGTLPLPEFNLAKAAAEFKRAWNGEVWEKGFKVQLVYDSGNSIRKTTMEMLAYYIGTLNPLFRVETISLQWPSYIQAQRNGLLPVIVAGWIADYCDPENYVDPFYSSQGTYGAFRGQTYREWAAVNVDEDILAARSTVDTYVREELYRDIQGKIIQASVGIPMFAAKGYHVQSTKVKGWFYNPARWGEYFYALSKETPSL